MAIRGLGSFLVLSVALSACTLEDRTSWIPQELDDRETLERLGDRGYQMVCDKFEGVVHNLYKSNLLIEAACTAHALTTTSDAASCAATTEDCLNTLPGPVEAQLQLILDQAGCGTLEVAPDSCKSSVSEMITCLGDLQDAVSDLKLGLTCAAFGSPVPSDWWRIANPQSCLDLARSCDK